MVLKFTRKVSLTDSLYPSFAKQGHPNTVVGTNDSNDPCKKCIPSPGAEMAPVKLVYSSHTLICWLIIFRVLVSYCMIDA